MIIPIEGSDFCIQCEFSNRHDGDMRQEPELQKYLIKKEIPEHSYILAQQIHDIGVRTVTPELKKRKITEVDGLVSAVSLIGEESITLAIRTADCVPILFYDDLHGVIGAAHSGWKGTYGNIAKEVIQEMVTNGAQPANINVMMGPHIRSCCYSVDTPRGESFLKKYGDQSVHQDGKIYYLHLDEVILAELLAEGVPAQNIAISTQCTSTVNETYFSYRKDSVTTFGEQISIIALKKVK